MNSPADLVAAAADRLTTATRTGRPVAPVRDLLGVSDVPLAYAVQDRLTRKRIDDGGTVVGRKIGLTSPAVQRQLGVDQPDFGVLFADMALADGATVAPERLLQAKIEAEIAFVLGDDLDGDPANLDADLPESRVRSAVGHAVAALEIVDSRVDKWDITITDTIADNASSGLFVVSAHEVPLSDIEPRDIRMRMFEDDRLVSEGSGADCLGDPITALTWLARTAAAFGKPLRAGQVVLSGALGPMVAVTAGRTYRAELGTLGAVAVTFAERSAS